MKIILLIVAFFFLFVSATGFSTFTAIAEEPIDTAMAEEEVEPEEVIGLSFPSAVSESTLAEDYILSVMPHKSDGLLRAARPSGLSLSGLSRKLYRLLAIYIDAVADGEESCTEFSFAAADVYEKTVYTAEDLGVESPYHPHSASAVEKKQSTT